MKKSYDKLIAFWWSSGLAYDAPALAFYILISLAPLSLGLSALAEIFFSDILSPRNITDSLALIFPERVGDNISDLARANTNQTPVLLLFSAFLMIWTVSSALSVIERAESRILRTENTRVLLGRIRLLGLGALFTLILLLILASFASEILPVSLSLLLPPLSFLSLALLYRFLPKSRAPWDRSFIGALPATLGLLFLPRVVGWYFASGFRPSFVGLFAALAVFIISCYFLAVFLLLGAGLAAQDKETGKEEKES